MKKILILIIMILVPIGYLSGEVPEVKEPVIKTRQVVPTISEIFCPTCKIELKQSPEVLTSYPPRYQYSCPKCEYSTTSIIDYPELTYK